MIYLNLHASQKVNLQKKWELVKEMQLRKYFNQATYLSVCAWGWRWSSCQSMTSSVSRVMQCCVTTCHTYT